MVYVTNICLVTSFMPVERFICGVGHHDLVGAGTISYPRAGMGPSAVDDNLENRNLSWKFFITRPHLESARVDCQLLGGLCGMDTPCECGLVWTHFIIIFTNHSEITTLLAESRNPKKADCLCDEHFPNCLIPAFGKVHLWCWAPWPG